MSDSFDALLASLTAQAAKLAEARARAAATAPAGRWRSAGLLWPLFTKG